MIIWQNYDLDLDKNGWREGIMETLEANDVDTSHLTEDDMRREMYELNDEYLDDERGNLKKTLPGTILIIADIGLWNGRHKGYKETNSSDLADCLNFMPDCDFARFYVDSHDNLRSEQTHHDGTHHLLYRYWNPETSEYRRDSFRNKLYFGTATPQDITRYTKSCGKEIRKIYGW